MKPRKMAIRHKSDCAVHNGPALKPGPCDCGAVKMPRKMQSRVCWCVAPAPPFDGYRILFETRAAARRYLTAWGGLGRVVRVRVTEAP